MENVLTVVLDNVRDGTLIEIDYWPPAQVRFARPPFIAIRPAGPWPDVVLYYFACSACQRKFRLSVEAFHGFGGNWAPWSPVEDE